MGQNLVKSRLASQRARQCTQEASDKYSAFTEWIKCVNGFIDKVRWDRGVDFQ